jgi:hypothetical protein
MLQNAVGADPKRFVLMVLTCGFNRENLAISSDSSAYINRRGLEWQAFLWRLPFFFERGSFGAVEIGRMSKQDLVGIAKVFGLSVGVNVVFLLGLWAVCGVLGVAPWMVGVGWLLFVVWWVVRRERC